MYEDFDPHVHKDKIHTSESIYEDSHPQVHTDKIHQGIRDSYLTWGTVSHRLFKVAPTMHASESMTEDSDPQVHTDKI